jgi:hypothetical protein
MARLPPHRLWPLLLVLVAPTGHGAPPASVRIGISVGANVSIDPPTLSAAVNHLINALRRQYPITANPYSVQTGFSIEDLETKLRSNELNAGSSSLLEYARLSSGLKLKPLVRGQVLGQGSFELIIVAPAAAGSGLAQLKGKVMSLYGLEAMHRAYLEVLLSRSKLPGGLGFFTSVRETKDPQSPALDVLLGEASAGLIESRMFASMSELNPQLKTRLRVIHRSERFSNAPIFVRADLPEGFRLKMRTVLDQLHAAPDGRQLMLMFKVERMLPAREADYESLRKLYSEYLALHHGGR